MGQDGVAIFVDCEEQIALRIEGEPCNVPSVCEGESVGFVVDQIKDSDAIAYGRE